MQVPSSGVGDKVFDVYGKPQKMMKDLDVSKLSVYSCFMTVRCNHYQVNGVNETTYGAHLTYFVCRSLQYDENDS